MIRAAATTAALLLALAAPAAFAQEEDEAPAAAAAPSGAVPAEAVEFRTLDTATGKVDGYLFRPRNVTGKAPAVVLMHNRDGLYSSRAEGDYKASTLSPRNKAWAQFWAGRGYYVLLVDSYAARGYPQGMADIPVKERPESVDDVNARPLDAYGALQYLRKIPEVDGDRIGLMGLAAGGSAVLATMADDKPGDMRKLGFRAGIAVSPFCTLRKRFDKNGYKPYAGVRLFMGAADQTSSPDTCKGLVERSRKKGGDVELTVYPGASHGFEEPGKRNQARPENAAATEGLRAAAASFFEQALTPR